MNVHGHPWSLNTRKVLATLAEKRQPFELVLVDLPHGGQHAPEHVRLHPFAKAPVLDDDGFVIYESLAILRHVDRAIASPALTPTGPRAAALMDQWISVAASYFEAPAHALLVEAIFKRVRAVGEPDRDAIRRHADAIARPLDVIDGWLTAHPYLAGDSFSLAELVWMPYLEYLGRLAIGREVIGARKHVAAWWARIRERPAWQQVAVSGAQPPVGADVA
jgi:glutathione S-transferase